MEWEPTLCIMPLGFEIKSARERDTRVVGQNGPMPFGCHEKPNGFSWSEQGVDYAFF